MSLKKGFFIAMMLFFESSYGLSSSAQSALLQQNELLQTVIDQNTSILQSSLNTSSQNVNALVWQALCPSGQTLDSANGCQPDCTGNEQGPCQLVLAATQILPLFALPVPSANSIIAFSVTPDSQVVTTGPLLTPPLNGASAYCIAVFASGLRVIRVVNTTSPGRSLLRVGALTDAAFLTTRGSTAILPIYDEVPRDGEHYSASSNTYYIICAAFTVNDHIPFSADVTGMTCRWN